MGAAIAGLLKLPPFLVSPLLGWFPAGSQAAREASRNKKGGIPRGFYIFPVTALGFRGTVFGDRAVSGVQNLLQNQV